MASELTLLNGHFTLDLLVVTSLWMLTIIVDFESVLEMVKSVKIKLGMVSWILDFNDVLPQERFVRQEVFPVFGLDVQFFDGLCQNKTLFYIY